MRIMLDTNVILSMALFPNKRFREMLEYIIKNHRLVLSSYVIHELNVVIERKFRDKKNAVEEFLFNLSYEFAYTPHEMEAGLFEIRDLKDYPVLYTAIKENVDILMTGDKDFKELQLEKPDILTPAEFIDIYM